VLLLLLILAALLSGARRLRRPAPPARTTIDGCLLLARAKREGGRGAFDVGGDLQPCSLPPCADALTGLYQVRKRARRQEYGRDCLVMP
jgi:hypothetical protein